MKMTKQEMQAKLNRKDIAGVGVKVTLWNGETRYYFYEDFDDSKGIDRAAKHFESKINNDRVRRAEYIYR